MPTLRVGRLVREPHHMRHITYGPFVLLTLAALGTVAGLAAPEQTRAAGLDFWHVADEEARLRAETSQRQDLDFEQQQMHERSVIGYEIARNFCDERLNFQEAINAVAELAEASPDWLQTLKTHYHIYLGFPKEVSDGAAMARYLHVKIDQMHRAAEIQGDLPRVTVLAARLALFDREAARYFPLTPAH